MCATSTTNRRCTPFYPASCHRMRRMKKARIVLCFLVLPMAGGMSVWLKLSPLIGGPSFLPIHVKVVVDEDNVFDFVPLNPTDPTIVDDLLRLKSVPGEIRSMGRQQQDCVSPLVKKADLFIRDYKDTNLHLIRNNCWTFALLLIWELSMN